MRIGFFDAEGWEKEWLQRRLPGEEWVFSKGRLKPRADLEAVSVFVSSPVTAKAIAKMPKLKLIVTRSTGFDHIDLAACKAQGVKVYNVPFYGANTVAEQAFALLLGLSRKLISCVDAKKCSMKLRGFDLQGKTLGVVGTGNIGKHAVRIGLGFGMKVVAFDVFPDKKFAKSNGFKYVTLDLLLSLSDVVTLHVPLNKHTFHLLNKSKIAKMKKGAVLINTSRGGVVDTLALLAALQKGRLSGAGLDVLEREELMGKKVALTWKDRQILLANKKLRQMSEVLVTPHNAFNTQEAIMRIMEETVKNIKSFKKGKKDNLVC